MSRFQFTPQAADDLFEIWSYIARDSHSVEAANRVEDAVYKACAFLAEGPLRGNTREDLTRLPLRSWTAQAIIVYDPETDPLQIIRVLHDTRNILAILGQGKP